MTVATATFEVIREFLYRRAAIVLEECKHYLLESRLLPVAEACNLRDLDALAESIRRGGNRLLEQRVLEAMTTNETSFFRDKHPFDALRTHVLPALIGLRSRERALHIWCAASSTGQEPYSIAMLLREHFPDLLRWSVRIIATDLSTQVLQRAKQGSYSQIEVNRGLPAPLLIKYFVKDGTVWQVKDEIRSMVDFRQMNLIEGWPPFPKLDIVFVRNVLIYFDSETKAKLLGRVRSVMRPDGYLMLGGAETTLGLGVDLRRVQIERTTWHQPS